MAPPTMGYQIHIRNKILKITLIKFETFLTIFYQKCKKKPANLCFSWEFRRPPILKSQYSKNHTRSIANSAYSHLIKTLNNNLSFVPFMLRSSQKALYLLAPFIAYSYTFIQPYTMDTTSHSGLNTLLARWTKTIKQAKAQKATKKEEQRTSASSKPIGLVFQDM